MLKLIQKAKGTKTVLIKKNKVGGTTLSDLKTYYTQLP